MGMTGPDRGMLYALAAGSGLRSKELRTLTPERFDLAADPPTVTVLAGYAKNRREAVQPLPSALTDRLAPWIATKPAGRPVFEGMTDRTAEMLAIDLKAAGIEPETASGVVDFHALRGTYISHLVSSGVSVKTCQVLARHSTPSLTIGIYAKASLHDIKGAVEALPDLTPTAPRTEAMAATGTEGKSDPTATPNATHPLAIVTQDVDQQTSYRIRPEDCESAVQVL
jgi:integrase